MLGMMNCPTGEQNFEFYAASPSVARQLGQHSSSSPKIANETVSSVACDGECGMRDKRSGSNALELFSGAGSKPRPKISYTHDGRRLINGKLETSASSEKLWNRLIVDSVTTSKLCRKSSSSGSQSQEAEEEEEKESAAGSGEKATGKAEEQGKKRRFSIGALFPKLLMSPKTRTAVPQQQQQKNSVTFEHQPKLQGKKCSAQSL